MPSSSPTVAALTCGLTAVCTNPSTGTTNDGTTMCHYSSGGSAIPCSLQCVVIIATPSFQPNVYPTRAPTDFSSELHGDQIAGVVIGVFFGSLLIAVLVYVCNMVLL